MTDKIIIDDVDVSRCTDIYCGTNCGNTGNSCPDIKCENNPNCYFKQLQQKEQEIKELKSNKKYRGIAKRLINLLRDKEMEIVELKTINKANTKTYKQLCYKTEKYKQTLDKIKELIKKALSPKKTKTISESFDCLYSAIEMIDGVKNGR